jgi:SAM-dependent methyltransferase
MFKHRHYTKELLDADNIPEADLFQNLKELNTINTLLGGHATTLKGLKHFLLKKDKVYQIAELGCGGGDNLRVIHSYLTKNNIRFELTGIDLKKECITYARQALRTYPNVTFIESDYLKVPQHFDIVFSSLFTHHLNDAQFQQYLDWCEAHSRLGFFINDLHRHPFAYYSIKLLTRFLSKSYLVKNDAPLSVLRGFKKAELKKYSALLPIELKWLWAFRWCMVRKKTNA